MGVLNSYQGKGYIPQINTMLREGRDHVVELGADNDVCVADLVLGRAPPAPIPQRTLQVLGRNQKVTHCYRHVAYIALCFRSRD